MQINVHAVLRCNRECYADSVEVVCKNDIEVALSKTPLRLSHRRRNPVGEGEEMEPYERRPEEYDETWLGGIHLDVRDRTLGPSAVTARRDREVVGE